MGIGRVRGESEGVSARTIDVAQAKDKSEATTDDIKSAGKNPYSLMNTKLLRIARSDLHPLVLIAYDFDFAFGTKVYFVDVLCGTPCRLLHM